MSGLLIATASGSANVYVPNQGWFIFGGDGNTLTRSQKLTKIDGDWELGPNVYNSKVVTGGCIVQVFSSTQCDRGW